ncbi:multidrug resistance-associated protein 1-like [Mizuhopecten yessoensis]|uniref:multidrug resistance-associated protein 1-like n=1 Tax=Mizuhopecten yessoensis TaxID=6573 RepID=UPI000B45DA66|nr:multidrug resistance-associated protein 1-like [Mizuhopecten yessoensis]
MEGGNSSTEFYLFENICGNSPFWTNAVLKSEAPKFTSCFQTTVLEWAPFAWLAVTLPIYTVCLCFRPKTFPLPLTAISITKTVGCVVLLALTLLQIWAVEEEGWEHISDITTPTNMTTPTNITSAGIYDPPTSFYLGIILRAVSLVVVGVFIQYVRCYGVVSSGVLYFYWVLLFVCGIIPLQSAISYQADSTSSILHYVYMAVLCVQFILHCFADTRSGQLYQEVGEDGPPCPDEHSSALSLFTYFWLTPIVIKAFKSKMGMGDLWEQTPRLKCENAVYELGKAWDTQQLKANIANRKAISTVRRDTRHKIVANGFARSGEDTPLLTSNHITSEDTDPSATAPKIKKASLYWSLFKTYGPIWIVTVFIKLISDITAMLQPVILGMIVSFIEAKAENRDPIWVGYGLSLLFALVGEVETLVYNASLHVNMAIGIRVKSALIGAIYQKSLRMSNSVKKDFTVGEIVNLMSVDCQRIQDAFAFHHWIFSFFSITALGLYLVWDSMGNGMYGCIVIVIIFSILNIYFGRLQERYQQGLLKLKGNRMKLLNEVLGGIKVLKMYAWEKTFTEKIKAIRSQEMGFLRKIAVVTAVSVLLAVHSPFFMNFAILLIYMLADLSQYLDATTAFTIISVVNVIRYPIALSPFVITSCIQTYVSVDRIQRFLWEDDLESENVKRVTHGDHAVSIRHGRFTWDIQDQTTTLTNIDFDVPEGSLVAVVGIVGSGKSSLISAVLGELEKLEGEVTLKGSLAYVPQEAWIQNMTLRDNILFGKAHREKKYRKVLEACQLIPDLGILSAGDQTEIGQKGINLSGGQKQRVSLARAVYNNADVYLLDDPLSAVDSHVGKALFQQVIGNEGLLKNKTRILVTHGVHWLPNVDRIIVMDGGQISEIGTYEELLQHNGPFAHFLQTFLLHDDDKDDEKDDEETGTTRRRRTLSVQEIKDKMWEQIEEVMSDGLTTSDDTITIEGLSRRQSVRKISKNGSLVPSKLLTRAISRQMSRSISRSMTRSMTKADDNTFGQLITEEGTEEGAVKWGVTLAYLKSMGVFATVFALFMMTVFQILNVYSTFWITGWTSDEYLVNTSHQGEDEYIDKNIYYLVVYGIFGIAQGICLFIFAIISLMRIVQANGRLHAKMLNCTFRSPMSFFDTTPIGRIMNRFSSDIDVLDDRMSRTYRLLTIFLFVLASTVVVISITTPSFLIALVPAGVVYVLFLRFYLPTARQLKRIESVTRSPVYNHFSETITGASVIRAYQASERFIEESQKRVDKNAAFYYAANVSARWISVVVETISNILVFAAALFAISAPELSGGDVGLTLTYSLQIVVGLALVVFGVSEMQMNIVSTERVVEYTDMPAEAEWIRDDFRPPPMWPHAGSIKFEGYTTRYRPGLELVLRGIDCEIQSGEKIGIVGRTGAGKSSLTVALFRLIESASGTISVDGIRTADLGLHDLRPNITILPQDPVLFSGPLKSNLDPLSRFTDHAIWKALESAHMKSFVQNQRDQLYYECGEGGMNLSVGQRQLVCLGRALLHKNKILILDEATAAVDMETDELIQQTIQSEFEECTVLTIAHRLNTIMEYDRVMVLDKGLIAEFETPRALLQDTTSVFYGMAKDAELTDWFENDKYAKKM